MLKDNESRSPYGIIKFVRDSDELDEYIFEEYQKFKEMKKKTDEINPAEHEERLTLVNVEAIDETGYKDENGTVNIMKIGLVMERAKIRIAKRLLEEGMSIEKISHITEFSKEEIEKLK